MNSILKKFRFSLAREMIVGCCKVWLMLACLYFFVCSLSFLSISFRLIGGRNIGQFFSSSSLLSNPVVGVVIGVLVTVLVVLLPVEVLEESGNFAHIALVLLQSVRMCSI